MTKGRNRGTKVKASGTWVMWGTDIAIDLNHRANNTKAMRSKPQQPNFIMYLSRYQAEGWQGTWKDKWKKVDTGGEIGDHYMYNIDDQ